MSNFKTFAQTLQGNAGTASVRFSASTEDSLNDILAANYLEDKANIVKANDIIEINYDLDSEPPEQLDATYGEFIVVADGDDLNLEAYPQSSLNELLVKNVTVTAAALASAGTVALLTGAAGVQYQLTEIFSNSGGTNFSGGGGDRLLSVTDGTTVYSVVPAASLQTLANARWGATAVPYPASAAIKTPTVANENLRAVYSGGAADYAAGSMVLTLVYARVV